MDYLVTRIQELFKKSPEELLNSIVHITWQEWQNRNVFLQEAYLRISAIETGPILYIQQPAPFDRIWWGGKLLWAHKTGEVWANNTEILSIQYVNPSE